MKLYPLLLEQANGRIPRDAQSGSQPAAEAQPAGKDAVAVAAGDGASGRPGAQIGRSRFFQANGLETLERHQRIRRRGSPER